MRTLARYLRNKRVVLTLIRYCSVFIAALGIYTFGTLFTTVCVEMRIALVVSFLSIAYGFMLMYFGIKQNKSSMTAWGYFITALGLLLIELGVLFLGGR